MNNNRIKQQITTEAHNAQKTNINTITPKLDFDSRSNGMDLSNLVPV